jgi:hypothetical protein
MQKAFMKKETASCEAALLEVTDPVSSSGIHEGTATKNEHAALSAFCDSRSEKSA